MSDFCFGKFKRENETAMKCHGPTTGDHLTDCQARVEALEARVRELEAEQELNELRAIVEAQEACSFPCALLSGNAHDTSSHCSVVLEQFAA